MSKLDTLQETITHTIEKSATEIVQLLEKATLEPNVESPELKKNLEILFNDQMKSISERIESINTERDSKEKDELLEQLKKSNEKVTNNNDVLKSSSEEMEQLQKALDEADASNKQILVGRETIDSWIVEQSTNNCLGSSGIEKAKCRRPGGRYQRF